MLSCSCAIIPAPDRVPMSTRLSIPDRSAAARCLQVDVWCRRTGCSLALAHRLPASAQTESILQGAVIDPSGAVVIGASVLVQPTDTGIRRQALTDTKGRYQVVALAAGIEVRAPSRCGNCRKPREAGRHRGLLR